MQEGVNIFCQFSKLSKLILYLQTNWIGKKWHFLNPKYLPVKSSFFIVTESRD